MYDFLYQDTQPTVSLLADLTQMSLPQTRLAISASLQAIVSALLAYQQRYQGVAVRKKLFGRNAVKELRQYNSMNFVTINAAAYHRQDVANAVFRDSTCVVRASDHIAAQLQASRAQVQTLLSTLCVVVLRELAILADYSRLDDNELDKWFALQPQFLSSKRTSLYSENVFDAQYLEDDAADRLTDAHHDDTNIPHTLQMDSANEVNAAAHAIAPPEFDPYWYELTGFTPMGSAVTEDMQQATSNYLKAIGRSPDNVRASGHNDMLIFSKMPNIIVPHQRWLLQLAKISDIYLSRNRLRITSEPTSPPAPPLVSLALLSGLNANPASTEETATSHFDTAVPLWKNPVIFIVIIVIGTLGALATLKYHMRQSDDTLSATAIVTRQNLIKAQMQQDTSATEADADTETSTHNDSAVH